MTGRRSSGHGAHHRSVRAKRLLERAAEIPAFSPVKPREYGTTKDVVGRAIAEAGGAKTVMALLDRSQSVVYAYADPLAERADLTVDQARKLTQFANAKAFAEDFAKLAGGAFLPGTNGEKDSWAAIGALCGKDGAEFQARLLFALSDGAISATEHRALEKETDDLLRAVLEARAKLAERAA